MRVLSKKLATLLLTLVFIFAMTTSTFAAWSSYQKNNVNNGTISTATYIGTSPTVNTLTLANNGAQYAGVDNESVLNGNRAYTLYNGGVPSSTNGGARLSAVSVTGTPSSAWNIQLDSSANNVQQLSTPYLDTSNNILYAATTHYTNDLAGTGVTGWKDSGNNPLSGFSFPVGTTAIHYDGLVVPSDYWEPQVATDINSATATISAQVTLTDGTNTYNFPASTYYGGNFTMFNSGGPMIPAGTYTLTVSITTNQALSATSFQFLTSNWNLYKVTGVNTGSPSASLLTSGYGQANTHINTASNNLYFGIYEGDRCYYQYDTGSSTLTSFKPGSGDDFYWAGAVKVTVSSADYMVFGSDSGTVYVRPVGSTFGSATGKSFTLSPTPGKIRSSICSSGSYIYFTSFTNSNGYLWRATTSTLLNPTPTVASPVTLSNKSTATPVVSDNSIIYVGTSNGFSAGTVDAVPVSSFNNASKVSVYSGDPVQSSVIVYSNPSDGLDYFYFTTNTATGKGYCRYADPSDLTDNDAVWSTSAGDYTLQGFASDNGYLVFGNDANTFYVIH